MPDVWVLQHDGVIYLANVERVLFRAVRNRLYGGIMV